MSDVVSVRLGPDELAEMKEQAQRFGRSLSGHVREMAVEGMRRNRPGVEVRRLPSGAELTTWGGVVAAPATNGVL